MLGHQGWVEFGLAEMRRVICVKSMNKGLGVTQRNWSSTK